MLYIKKRPVRADSTFFVYDICSVNISRLGSGPHISKDLTATVRMFIDATSPSLRPIGARRSELKWECGHPIYTCASYLAACTVIDR